jgi:hypothetical protein
MGLEGLKDALVAELRKNAPAGMSKEDLEAAFPHHSWAQLRRILVSMREERVRSDGQTRAMRWHALDTPA